LGIFGAISFLKWFQNRKTPGKIKLEELSTM